MSKRGGASEINGFISVNTDVKKPSVNRKDNEKISKVRGETSSRQQRDPSREKNKNVKTPNSNHQSFKDSPTLIAQRSRREGLQVEKTIKVKESPSTTRTSKLKNESSSSSSSRSSKTLDNRKTEHKNKLKTQDPKLKTTSTSHKNTESQKQRDMKLKYESSSNQNLTQNIKSKNSMLFATSPHSKKETGPLTKQSTFSLSDKKSDVVKVKSSSKNITVSSPKNVQSGKPKIEKSLKTRDIPVVNQIHSVAARKQNLEMYSYDEGSSSISYQDKEEPVDVDYNYEDDFENYESDFEDYIPSEDSTESSSEDDMEKESETEEGITETNSQATQIEKDSKQTKVEEERKLDSGSYDLTNDRDLRRKKQIQEIKNAIDKENAAVMSPVHISISPEDEGFEEVQTRNCTPTFMEISTSKGFINFTNARKHQLKQKAKEKVQHRGELLLNMIRLDAMNYSLFNMPSVPYETYIKCYGRSNTQQMHTQTGEDDLCEEVQTDEITCSTKWTQHPINFSSPNTKDHHTFIQIFSQERLGVGGEITIQENEKWNPKIPTNTMNLHNFISSAGEVMLILLEESERESQSLNNFSHNNQDFGFSDGFTELNTQSVPFLKGRSVNLISFSQSNITQIITIHQPSSQPKNIRQESESRCLLCVWSVLEPSSPQKILVASNTVTAVSFHSHLVFAGLSDGSLCVWDLREKGAHHQQSLLKQYDWILRSPTYITAEVLKEKGHLSTVVSVQVLPDANGKVEKSPTQVVSVDEEGFLIVWTVIENVSGVSTDMGLAHWGKVRLIPSSKLYVLECFPSEERRNVLCQCLAVDLIKPSNLYVGTNTGQVVHCLQSSTKTRPQVYFNNTEEPSSITCLEFSKCGYPTLLVGDNEGQVRIYRTASEKPILNLFATVTSPSPGVKSLQMSPCHPGLFFVLDTTSSLHVWDLCSGDLYPMFSVPFKDQVITTAQLSPHINVKQMALATTSGQVQIHQLKSEFCQQSVEAQHKEYKKFERYINIL